MNSYKLSRLAQHDLEKIWDYTIHEWSLNQAEIYIDGLLRTFEAPGDGKLKDKPDDSVREGYKKALYSKHVISFRLSPKDEVEIIRVLHVSIDTENHF